jgi:RHS repeat-associated protein
VGLILLISTSLVIADPVTYCGRPGEPGGPPDDHRQPCPKCTECKASPCFAAWGDYVTSAKDLSLPTRGLPLEITRTYDSARAVDGILGVGWTSNLTTRLTYVTYLVTLEPLSYRKKAIVSMGEDRLEFTDNYDGTFTPPPKNHDTLVKNADNSFDYTPALSRTKYHFADDGSLQWIDDEYGNRVSYLYDGNGRLYRVEDGTGSGRYLDIVYNPNGRIDYITDSEDRRVNFNYNATDGTLTSVKDPVNRRTKYSYVASRFGPVLSRIRDEWDRVISDITYVTSDDTNRTIGRVHSYSEAGETYTYQYYYEGDLQKTAKSDSSGNTKIFTYNSQGQISDTDLPGDTTTHVVYNTDGSIQQTTDGEGVVTNHTYNTNGSTATVTRGSGTVQFSYAYEDANFPEKVTSITPVYTSGPNIGQFNPDWQAWRYDYWAPGNPAPGSLHHGYRVESDGTTLDTMATYSYNGAGQALTATDATGAVTTYGYNSTTGDLTSVTYPKNSDAGANPVYQYGRDGLGRVSSVTDPLNHVTSYIYDDVDRITSVTLPKPTQGSPLDFTTIYSYDNFDSPSSLVFTNQTDPNSKITKQGYDQYGQLVKSVDASNKTATFTYLKGLLTSITDANNNVTGYNYDTSGRLAMTTFPDNLTENYTYRRDSLLDTKTDRKSQLITYSYDNLKRLTGKIYQGTNGSITYSYVNPSTGNLAQNLFTITDTYVNPNATETHTFTYDASYHILTNAQDTRGTLTYSYDPADRVQAYSVSGGTNTTYTYYADGSLKDITWSPISGQFQYAYTLNGQYGLITFPNSQHRDYTYDDQGRLTQIANIHPTVGNLATYAYGYDVDNYTGNPAMLGQRSSLTATVPAQSFSGSVSNYYYDSNYQFTKTGYPNVAPYSAEVDSWTYDNIGNRLTNTVNGSTANYTYNHNGSNPQNPLNGQRLQSDGTRTYTYDNNGNLSSDGTYNYTWNYENRLIAIGGGLPASYIYDYLGRRSSKTVGGPPTTYLYNGQNLIRESGVSTTDYLFGPGVDEPLAMVRNSTPYYFDVDGLGSATLLNDASGAVQDNYVLDAWGNSKAQTVNVANPFTYTARESSEAGLMFYRARYYNPSIGRFISEDPVRFNAGINLFTYTLNRPIVYRDPSGTFLLGCGKPPSPKDCGCYFFCTGIIEVSTDVPPSMQCRGGKYTWKWGCYTEGPGVKFQAAIEKPECDRNSETSQE